ncbi:phage tail tube protein [Escherichia coli]
MPTPNPLAPVKGAGTTLWVYTGKGDAYANPLSDDDWQRLAKVKDLTPGEMTAESYDDNYLDDEDADWSATGQGQKSAGDTSFTLAWKPGEEGQKGLIGWFESGDVRAYKIRFPNGTVDVFRGWISSIGKAVTAKEVITRTVKVTNVGKPSVAEERSEITPATAIKVTPTSGIVHRGEFVFTKEATSRIGVGNLYRLMRGYAEGGYVGGAGSPAQMRRAEGISFNQNNHVVIQNDGTNGQAGPQLMKAVYDMARKGAQDEIQAQMRDGGVFSGGRR